MKRMTVKKEKNNVSSIAVKNTRNIGVSFADGIIAFEISSNNSSTNNCWGLNGGIG